MRTSGLLGLFAVSGLAASLLSGCAPGGPATTPSAGATPTQALTTPTPTLPPASATASAPASASAPSSSSPSAVPVSTTPATFALTVTGDANVTGIWGTSYGVDCDSPTFAGPDIIFFAQSPDGKAVVFITLGSGSISVSERAGQGATYTERDFTGTGVSAFDPAKGGTFDSDLSIVPNPNSKPGTLGTITHVKGSIDCGGQTPGTSTVTLSGATPDGTVSGPFSAFRVQCNASAQYGNGVSLTAIATAGTNPTLMIINLPSNHHATIFATGQNPGTQHSYSIDPAGTYTITGTGATIDADFVEVLAAGATGTPARIHLAGDVGCGTFNKGP